MDFNGYNGRVEVMQSLIETYLGNKRFPDMVSVDTLKKDGLITLINNTIQSQKGSVIYRGEKKFVESLLSDVMEKRGYSTYDGQPGIFFKS